jgi:hypothetical protein
MLSTHHKSVSIADDRCYLKRENAKQSKATAFRIDTPSSSFIAKIFLSFTASSFSMLLTKNNSYIFFSLEEKEELGVITQHCEISW